MTRAISLRPAAFALIFCLPLLFSCAGGLPDPRAMSFPPVEITEPEVETLRLENGIAVYLLPDPSTSLVNIHVKIRTGSAFEPEELPGVAGLTGTMMREGGAGDMDPDTLDEHLDHLAIQLSSSIGYESGGAGVSTLSRHLPTAVDRLADMLRRPRFDEGRIAVQKGKMLEAIRRRNDNPGSIAGRKFAELLYGLDHPRGRPMEAADVERLTRQHLIAFHRKYYRPDNIMIGVTGGFEREEILELIRRRFADWQAPKTDFPPILPVPETPGRTIAVVHKPLNQATLYLGHTSIRRTDPDYYTMVMASDVLSGGGMDNRLFQEVRARRGLAYSVWAGLNPGYLDRGLFRMGVQSKTGSAAEAVQVMLDEVERLRTEAVPVEELEHRQEAFLNRFVFTAESAGQVLGRRMTYDYHGLPADELTRLRDGVLAVEPQTMMETFARQVHPERMAILAVGDREVLIPALSRFGEVIELPLEYGEEPAP